MAETLLDDKTFAGQQSFLYPALESDSTTLHTDFLINKVYLPMMDRYLKQGRLWQGTFAHFVGKLDGGFKVRTQSLIVMVLCKSAV